MTPRDPVRLTVKLADDINALHAFVDRIEAVIAYATKEHALARLRAEVARFEPIDWQRRHSPVARTRIVLARTIDPDTGELVEHAGSSPRRRVADARLWEAMTAHQQDAAEWIQRGFVALVGELAIRTSRVFEDEIARNRCYDKALASVERDAMALLAYKRWVRECAARGDNIAAALNVLCFGADCASVDKASRRRHGWARERLFEALDVYCKVRGWPVEAKSSPPPRKRKTKEP